MNPDTYPLSDLYEWSQSHISSVRETMEAETFWKCFEPAHTMNTSDKIEFISTWFNDYYETMLFNKQFVHSLTIEEWEHIYSVCSTSSTLAKVFCEYYKHHKDFTLVSKRLYSGLGSGAVKDTVVHIMDHIERHRQEYLNIEFTPIYEWVFDTIIALNTTPIAIDVFRLCIFDAIKWKNARGIVFLPLLYKYINDRSTDNRVIKNLILMDHQMLHYLTHVCPMPSKALYDITKHLAFAPEEVRKIFLLKPIPAWELAQ